MADRLKFFQKANVAKVEDPSGFTLPPFDSIVVASALGLMIGLLIVWKRYQTLQRSRRDWIVVDGSNVLYWDNQVPSLKTVQIVLNRLKSAGFYPKVFFDANVGYVVGTRYFSERDLARHLPISKTDIVVSDSGTPADPLVISEAKRLHARVVTNDRFNDWSDAHPEVKKQTFFVRGQVNNGQADFEFVREKQAAA